MSALISDIELHASRYLMARGRERAHRRLCPVFHGERSAELAVASAWAFATLERQRDLPRSLARRRSGRSPTARAQQPADPLAALKAKFARPTFVPNPAGNPPTAAKVALGKRLFEDPELSATGTIACASCHDPKLAFTDGESTGKGVTGRPLARHTPTLWNVAWSPLLFWDGRASSLEDQIRFPVEHPDEMGSSLENAVDRFSRHDSYVQRLRASLPAGPADHAAQHRQGARRLRAHAGVAADALRPMGRRRCGRAVAFRGQRLCASSPARAAASTATPASPSPTTASTTSACRARTRAAAPTSACPPPTTPSRCRPCASWPGPRPTCTTARSAPSTTWCASTRWAASSARRAAKDLPRHHQAHGQERADLVAFLETLSSETPPQPSREPWVNAGRAHAGPRCPADTTVVSQSQQAVLAALHPRQGRPAADRAQRRHPHPQRAHLRPALRLQFGRAGAARDGDDPLSRPRHLRGLLRHPPLHAADRGGGRLVPLGLTPSLSVDRCEHGVDPEGLTPPPSNRAGPCSGNTRRRQPQRAAHSCRHARQRP